ncbi:MAG: AAA family ATPase [Limnochordaceae bacterium]|nr:AAA family ATPase [Limnochordaceae bacterium]
MVETPTLPPLPGEAEAERRILGILIKHPEQVDVVLEAITPEHFMDPVLRQIFQIVVDLYTAGQRVSYTQVYTQLRLRTQVPEPEALLAGLTESFISLGELVPSMEVLLENSARRKLLAAAREIARLASEGTGLVPGTGGRPGAAIAALQARAQQLIMEAVSVRGTAQEDITDLLTVLNRCYAKLVDRREGKASAYGLSVRYPSVDLMTTGLQPRDLIVLAARPSMGKTSLALNFAVNVAKRGIPVLIFSLEMDAEQIGDRLVVSELFGHRKDGRPLVTAQEYAGKLTDEQFEIVKGAFNELFPLPIYLVDRRGLSVTEIRAKARKFHAAHPDTGLIIIDYLQLIRAVAVPGRTWAMQVGDIVRELRDMAGELNVPLILLSQLNRGVEAREDKRPLLSDLRDSGNIEEFADVVIMLYRDDYYNPEKARENGTEGQVEVIFAKQRRGRTGKVLLRWIPEFTRFIDEVPAPGVGGGEVTHGQAAS